MLYAKSTQGEIRVKSAGGECPAHRLHPLASVGVCVLCPPHSAGAPTFHQKLKVTAVNQAIAIGSAAVIMKLLIFP